VATASVTALEGSRSPGRAAGPRKTREFRGRVTSLAYRVGNLGYGGRRMATAFRPIGHIAAWIVWHATRVSLLADLERPQPPRPG
jgi:hypothetical protein